MSQVRIAAVSDIHYTKTSKGALQDLFVEASSSADVLLICGDFTDYGLPEEAAYCRRSPRHAGVRRPGF